MLSEAFEVVIKGKGKKQKHVHQDDDYESDITDDEGNAYECSDDEQTEILEYLESAFGMVSTVEAIGYREFELNFKDQNATLIEDDDNYEFEMEGDIPVLYDTKYFIPFVNHVKEMEPSLTGVSLYTNLEGGGSLVI